MKNLIVKFVAIISIIILLSAGTATGETIHADCTVAGLINAINIANSLQGSNTIVLTQGCVYNLSSVDNETADGDNGLPQINSSIIIEGNGATIKRSASAPEFRFFQVNSSASLSIRNLILENGRLANSDNSKHNGGCIYVNGGVASINYCILKDNYAGCGGAVLSSAKGTLTVNGSYFSNNTSFL